MPSIKILTQFFLLLFLGSCAFKTPPEDYKSANPNMADPTKTFASSLESPALQPLVFGNWQGQLPCADCEGITYYLTLQKDKTFRESSEYRGKNTPPLIENGTWQVNEDSVVQLTKSSGRQYLQISKNNLVILDHNGQRIASSLASKYVLKRPGNSNGNSNVVNLEEKRLEGVDFYASGNTWTIEIDTERAIRFRGQNNKMQLTSEIPTVQTLPGGKGNVYRAITNAGTLAVRVLNQPCSDKASGKTLAYTVEVTANAQEYTGCGQYLTDNRLKGNWALQEMNGQPLKSNDFPKGMPNLDLQPETNIVAGSSGCNRITGSINLTGDQIGFGNLAGTKMACPGPAMAFEKTYLKLLSGQTFTYQLEADQLFLKNNNSSVLVYKKVN